MKVFLSSTYTDLIEHRKAAHDALEQLGLHVIGMETFGARPIESTKACLDEVRKSDLFVGIYGHRYGYIPEDKDISITEQEFDHAQKLGKPIFGFIVDDDFIWHQKYFEHDKKAKLDAFLSKVKKQPVEFFTTPDNLANNVSSSIGFYLADTLKSEKSSDSDERDGQDISNISWSERNKESIAFFMEKCESTSRDLDMLMQMLTGWQLLFPTKNGLYFSVDGACMFGPTDKLPKGFFSDIVVDDRRTGKFYVFNGCSIFTITDELFKLLRGLWESEWENPSERYEGKPVKYSDYPEVAIVEAMINFIIHRDYTINLEAHIVLEDDHIEFINPGTSPFSASELLTSEKVFPNIPDRNAQVRRIMSRTSLNQRQGKGIIRIRESLAKNKNLRSDGSLGLDIKIDEKAKLFSLLMYKASRKVYTNSLPQQTYFFGRARELAIIAEAISPYSRTWGALIDGPGGIGKTALAIKAAHNAPAELFEHKIFLTAKVRELTADGEAKLTDFTRPTYLAMLDELGKELGADGLEKLAPDERPNELRLALAGKKALIIFDNLETLPEDERTRLFQFLSRLPTGNKAIVTSRRRTDVDARIVRLDRLARDEALQFTAELAAKTPRLDRASQKEREDLFEITQGNPLFIRWIAGQLGREGSQCRTIAEACAFIDKAPKGNDPLEYIFGDLLETFTADETKVLAALTYFSLPAKLKWIADMTDLPERAAETALEDLTDRSILTSNLFAQTYFLPPLTAKFIRTRHHDAVTQTGDTLTNNASALAQQYGGATNYEGFHTLDAEWDFISAALPHLLTGDNFRLQTVCTQLETFLNFTGRWDDLLWLSEQAEARAIASDDKEKAGWRAYQAGVIYNLRNQPAEVQACAARATEYWQNSTPHNKAFAIRLRGLGYELQKDFSSAINAYREALDINRSISPESIDIAIGLSNLANIELANKDYPSAEHNYREALQIAKKINYQEGVTIMTGNLAELALDREQWAEAESLAREALALAEIIGKQELIANDCHRLAQALLKQDKNLEEALSLSRRAVEIYTRLRSPRLQSAQETLAEIERAVHE